MKGKETETYWSWKIALVDLEYSDQDRCRRMMIYDVAITLLFHAVKSELIGQTVTFT